MGKKPTIPTRWDKYRPMKDVIEGTRFLPFKTPYNGAVRRGIEFNSTNLLERVSNLGIVLNLVLTKRYYNTEIYAHKDVIHHQEPFHGRGTLPSQDEIERVFRHIDRFIEANETDTLKLIGVHCTHGVNRTGYVICRYMIEKLGFEPGEAIRRFEAGRGHEFDHPELKDALHQLQPSEEPNLKRWHSIGGTMKRGTRENEVRVNFSKLLGGARGDLANTEGSSKRESRLPRTSPPRSVAHPRRQSPPPSSRNHSRHRSRSPARNGRTDYQDFARDVELPGSYWHYLGPRDPSGMPNWPRQYVGRRRQNFRRDDRR